jgi:hypothetical protein
MPMSTTANGRARPQLADEINRMGEQLDRADRILDALSEGLDGAVRDSAREGTRLAVKEAVVALLTDPELRTSLHQASAPPARVRISPWRKLTAAVRKVAARVGDGLRSVASAVADRVARGAAAAGRVVARVRSCAHVRTVVKVLAAALAMFALARAGTARRVASLVERARSAVSDRAVAAWARVRGIRLLSASA